MIYIIIGLALAAFSVLVWSLCRASADADDLARRVYENAKDEPC
jgi:hypothetical protein